MQKLKALFKKYEEPITYLFFGGLTTLVNYLVYLPCIWWLGFPETVQAAASNTIAWVVAVAFAFLTNKPFVFKSHDWSWKTVLPELSKFVSCRAGSWLLETLILWVAVDLLAGNSVLWKLVTSVLVVIVNYVASKLLVFSKK